jgi:hypothetical protein
MGEMRARLLMPLLLAAAAPPLPAQSDDPKAVVEWIRQRVQAGDVADLNERCGTRPLDIHKRDDARWSDPCRRVDPVLLRALLTQPDLADHAPHGVRFRGARIGNDLDLGDAHVRPAEVWLHESWVAGDVNLADARLDGLLSLQGTLITGNLVATRAQIGGNLFLRNAQFGGAVDLRGAYVEGQMNMEGASVANEKTFDAQGLHVGARGLILRKVAFGGPVYLRDARVDGPMAMESASVAGQQAFNAERLHIGAGGLFLRLVTFGGSVDLRDAHVDGFMDMDDTNVADKQTFQAERLHVGAGGLFLRNVRFGGEVVLRDVHVDGQMGMDGASVADEQTFIAETLHVGRDFVARGVTFGGAVNFLGIGIDGDLDLQDAHVRRLDMAGAVIRDDLRLGGRSGDGSEHRLYWEACDDPTPCLNLRNARIGNLQDDEQAWPPRITLEGFSYTHLGGIGGEERQDMRNRPIRWWRRWLKRDPVYSAQPYAQLASVLTAAGNRDGAADIRYFGRDRERSELLRGCQWALKLGLVEKPDDSRPCGLRT